MVRGIRGKAPWVLAFFGMFVSFSGLGQVSQQATQTSPQSAGESAVPQGGAATGGVFAPVLDAEKRPITAGGFVKTGPIVFQDVSGKAGLNVWHHKMGTPQKNYILETTGSGVALLDYDNDGWLDIYLVNGSTLEALDGKA
jgi:enediyne biosynthesis protein E4